MVLVLVLPSLVLAQWNIFISNGDNRPRGQNYVVGVVGPLIRIGLKVRPFDTSIYLCLDDP